MGRRAARRPRLRRPVRRECGHSNRRRLLLTQAGQKGRSPAPKLEESLARHLRLNTPYDQLIRDMLIGPDAEIVYRSYGHKPENIAGIAARLFLGVKLECAQCHDDRTGAPWKRTQFWEYAAFFSGPTPNRDAARIRIPDTTTWVEGRFLDGSRPARGSGPSDGTLMADWLTRPDNP